MQWCRPPACLHYGMRDIRIRELIMIYFNANAANEIASGFPRKRRGHIHFISVFQHFGRVRW